MHSGSIEPHMTTVVVCKRRFGGTDAGTNLKDSDGLQITVSVSSWATELFKVHHDLLDAGRGQRLPRSAHSVKVLVW
jgi:hypothetical protein